MWHDFEKNEQTVETCAWNEKKYVLFMLYYIDKNWYHFIKEYLEQFSNFAFQKVAHPVSRLNRHILEILLARRNILVTQNRRASFGLHHCLFRKRNRRKCKFNTYLQHKSYNRMIVVIFLSYSDLIKDHHFSIF